MDRLSSLLEKAATSEQIRKSLTQEEVRKMKVMASKVSRRSGGCAAAVCCACAAFLMAAIREFVGRVRRPSRCRLRPCRSR